MQFEIINIAITIVCLIILGIYFNYREKKLTRLADTKFLDIREKYLVQVAQRKAKEKAEIDKIKNLVLRLENKHKKLISHKSQMSDAEIKAKATEITHKAEEKARQIEEEAKQKARKFLEDQKKEVEVNMVDLVMDVSSKVLGKSLSYEDQKALVDKALMEVEGDINNDD